MGRSLSGRCHLRHLNRLSRLELHFGYRLLIPIEACCAVEGSARRVLGLDAVCLLSGPSHFEPKVESFVMPSNFTQQVRA
jgi:hypothetical protein